MSIRASALLSALLLAALACDDSSPTAPEPPAQVTSSIVFSDAGALSDHRATITDLIEQTVAQARTALSIDHVVITVFSGAARTIPGYGIGGYAINASSVELVVDPNYPGLAQVLPLRLPHVVAHELHHVARIRGVGYGMTLLENMISEGLADHFAIERLGTPVPPWCDAFSEDRTEHFLARAHPELDSTAFDFDAWFFGLRTDLPPWTGYTLGFRLVADYLHEHPGATAAGLVSTPADRFRP